MPWHLDPHHDCYCTCFDVTNTGFAKPKKGVSITLIQGGIKLEICGVLYRAQQCVQELGCVPWKA